MNLNVVKQQSGAIPVGDPDALAKLAKDWMVATQSGYFYTYVTNRSSRSVYPECEGLASNQNGISRDSQIYSIAKAAIYSTSKGLRYRVIWSNFNNLKVDHQRGSVKQIFNYYPYGLMWENPTEQNANAYQGKEWQQQEWGTTGLEMYDFHVEHRLVEAKRKLSDANPVAKQYGTPDPMNQFDSPYNAMGDNPVVNIDPDGMLSIGGIASIAAGAGAAVRMASMLEIATSRGCNFNNVYSLRTKDGYSQGLGSQLFSLGMAIFNNALTSVILNNGMERVVSRFVSRGIDECNNPNTYNHRVFIKSRLTQMGFETNELEPNNALGNMNPTFLYLKVADHYERVVFDPSYKYSNGCNGTYLSVKPIRSTGGFASDLPLEMSYNSVGKLNAASVELISNNLNQLLGSVPVLPRQSVIEGSKLTITVYDGRNQVPEDDVEGRSRSISAGNQAAELIRTQLKGMANLVIIHSSEASYTTLNQGLTNVVSLAQDNVAIQISYQFYVHPY